MIPGTQGQLPVPSKHADTRHSPPTQPPICRCSTFFFLPYVKRWRPTVAKDHTHSMYSLIYAGRKVGSGKNDTSSLASTRRFLPSFDRQMVTWHDLDVLLPRLAPRAERTKQWNKRTAIVFLTEDFVSIYKYIVPAMNLYLLQHWLL